MLRSLTAVGFQFLLTIPVIAGLVGEVPVGPPIYSNAVSDQTSGRVALNGDRYLAVWVDERENTENLYAARFDNSGNLLDPTNIRIPLPHGMNRIMNGLLPLRDTWVVIWSEQDFTSETPVPQSNVMVARVDRDGRLIDPPRVVLSDAISSVPQSAATNGSQILIAYDNKYALLDEDGMLLRRDLLLPFRAGAVASNGSDFLVQAGARFITVNSTGDIAGTTGDVVAPTDVVMGLASDRSQYLSVTRNFKTGQFSSLLIGADVQAPRPLPAVAGIPTSGDLIWNDTSYVFAVWTTNASASPPYQQIVAVRLDPSGNAIDAAPFALSERASGNGNSQVSIASSGVQLVSVWHTSSATSANDAFATIADATSLQRSNPILLSQAANIQVNPAFAFSGRNFLAIWQETTGTYLGRIGLNGEALDGRGVRITPNGYTPRVIFDGSNYLVGWLTTGRNVAILWVSRVTPDGQILDGDGLQMASSNCLFNFDMTSTGERTLVVWDECGYHALRAMQIDRNAQPVGISMVITPESMRTANPSIAWSGNKYLVAFQEQIRIPGFCPGPPTCEVFRSNIRAVRLSSELTVLDTDPLPIAVSDSDNQQTPLVASDGKGFLAGWNATEMRTRSIASDGSLGPVSVAGAGSLSSLIWDGVRYALAFTAAGDAFLAHAGAGDRLAISATADQESGPRLVAMANGTVTAAYVRVATEPLYGGVPRSFLRELQPTRARSVRAH